MENTTFPIFMLFDLKPGDWIRTTDGEIGLVHDRVTNPSYAKARVEFPGERYPMRIMDLSTQVEHVTDRKHIFMTTHQDEANRKSESPQ
ncbi:hypothetical protein [Pseudomonas sp.]|uniref:hypothetical protein n=1 Tax=Pseudomonas sp. TaxID=306 RepID=UPI003FD7573C